MNNYQRHTGAGCIFCLLLVVAALRVAAQPQRDTLPQVLPTAITITDTAILFNAAPVAAQSVQVRPLPESVLLQLRRNAAFWYAQQAPQRQQVQTNAAQKPSKPFFLLPWFRVLVWVLIIASFVAVLIWYLAVSNLRLFRPTPAAIGAPEALLLPEDIFSIPYEQELERAAAAGNYRLHIRLLYLQTLKLFAEKNLIQFKPGRTNSEYLWQLRETPHYQTFAQLTRRFEYTWYGQFTVSEPVFRSIQSSFHQVQNSL